MMADSYYTITIKNEVTGQDTITIPANGFSYVMMDELHFPNAIHVGDSAFIGCTELKEIDLPEALMIGNGSFMGCSSATRISIPKATTIGNNAFSGCTAAATMDVRLSETIGYNAFQDCSSVVGLNIPKATDVGENAFRGCKLLERISCESLQTVGKKAFFGCSSLKQIVLPSAFEVGEAAFAECSAITDIELPGISTVDALMFKGCKELRILNLQGVPVNQLPSGVFSGLNKLEWLNIQNQITRASMDGEYRTYLGLRVGCSVVCSDGIRYGNDDRASAKSNLLDYNEDDTANPFILGLKSGSSLPETFTEGYACSIASEAFMNQTSAKSIFLPGACREIGPRAFHGCGNLQSVSLPQMSPADSSGYGIKANAFANCPNLRYVLLGKTTMGDAQPNCGNWGIPSGCIVSCSDGAFTVA